MLVRHSSKRFHLVCLLWYLVVSWQSLLYLLILHIMIASSSFNYISRTSIKRTHCHLASQTDRRVLVTLDEAGNWRGRWWMRLFRAVMPIVWNRGDNYYLITIPRMLRSFILFRVPWIVLHLTRECWFDGRVCQTTACSWFNLNRFFGSSAN